MVQGLESPSIFTVCFHNLEFATVMQTGLVSSIISAINSEGLIED